MSATWRQVESVTPGGKPYFYVKALTEYTGFRRVVWHRDVRAYAATVDRKYTDRPMLVGYYSTVNEARQAADAAEVKP